MSIIEGTVPTLFGGVSRQPPQVRQPNQVERMDNALASVVTGGFEKRPCTRHVAELAFLSADDEYKIHPIDRSTTERTLIAFRGGATPSIFALDADTGAQLTVAVGDTTREFLIGQTGVNSTQTIGGTHQVYAAPAETTFDWAYELSNGSVVFKVEGSADGSVWNDIATGKTGTSGTFSTTVDAVATGDHNYVRFTVTTAAGGSTDYLNIRAAFADLTYLLNADPEDIQVVSVADFTFITNRNVTARMGPIGTGSITSTVQTFSDLPAATGSGNIHRVRGTDSDGFGTFYVKDNGSGDWIETVDPTIANSFDEASMPHQLVRSADGLTYTFSAASWESRASGDTELNPDPGFIGGTINDVAFYRNRLVLLSDEVAYLSQSGDVFNMFVQKATDVLDSDPIERGATTTSVNILQFAATFRKQLFMTSAQSQFEFESGEGRALTPETAELNQATSYKASTIAKPKVLGDVLYFSAASENAAVIYEYYFQDSSFSNTATDVTRHVRTYIPNDVLEIATDPSSQTMYILSTGAQNALYVYRTFFDDSEKLQSSWGRYLFGSSESDAFVHGFAIFGSAVHMIIERADGFIYLETFTIDREGITTGMPFMPLIDQRDLKTGTYDSTHDVTHWTADWEHDGADGAVVLGPSGAIPGRTLTVTHTPKYLLTLASVTAGQTLDIGGKTFTAHATTTTAADREFDISGNDIADAGELTTVLNDSTDGIGATHAATDNLDGTIFVVPIDKVDGTLAEPTGTAAGDTIIVTQIFDTLAARGDHSAADAYIGRHYTMTVELTKIVPKEDNIPVVTGRLQLKDMTTLYEKTGYFEMQITPDGGRPAKSYKFEGKVLGGGAEVDGSSVVDSGVFGQSKVLSRADTTKIEYINDRALPCVITSVQWRGFFSEIGRGDS